MSEVSQGGATVFAYLNLTVTPKKGSALFWDNLLPSGEIDKKGLHAACPVLRGSKWGRYNNTNMAYVCSHTSRKISVTNYWKYNINANILAF